MQRLVLTPEIREEIISHCRAEHPDEACGLISGRDGIAGKVYPMTNVEKSPVSYFMDPGEQFLAMKRMREEGQPMIAIYHSHPCSAVFPSPKDISLAFYEEALYLIVGLTDYENPVLRAFRIIGGDVAEAAIEIRKTPGQG